MSGLLILGAGGHGLVVADAAHEMGCWPEIAFLDDDKRDHGAGDVWPIIGRTSELERLRNKFSELAVAIGANDRRLELVLELIGLEYELPVIVHPTAYVSSKASIGSGTVILAQSAINPATTIGRACIVNTSASVDHDCWLDDGVHISPGAHLAGGVRVGRCAWLGIGSSVRDRVTIGQRAMLGAGAVAIDDIPDDCTAIGVPAKI